MSLMLLLYERLYISILAYFFLCVLETRVEREENIPRSKWLPSLLTEVIPNVSSKSVAFVILCEMRDLYVG